MGHKLAVARGPPFPHSISHYINAAIIFLGRDSRQDRLLISYLKGSLLSFTFSSLKGTGWSDLPGPLPDPCQIGSSSWPLGTTSKRERGPLVSFISSESMKLFFFVDFCLFFVISEVSVFKVLGWFRADAAYRTFPHHLFSFINYNKGRSVIPWFGVSPNLISLFFSYLFCRIRPVWTYEL